MSKVNNSDYHGALALNNIGVLFLEAGCYEKGLITLKDAVNSMHMVFTEDQESVFMVDVNRKLHKANKHFCELVTGSGEVVMDTLFYEKKHIPFLRSHDQASLSALRPTKIHLPQYSSSFCTRGRDPDLESVVILCNAGLSYYLVSSTKNDPGLASALLQNSYYVLSLACDIVTNRFAFCEHSSEEIRLMTVALLVTGTMAQIFNETGRNSDAKSFELKYQLLVEASRLLQTDVKSV